MKHFPYIFILILTIPACTKHKDPLLTSIPSSYSGIGFSNDVTNSDELNIFNYRNFYNGGGVAIGDINNDGLADIFLTGNRVENKLYLNKGNLKFEDITTTSALQRKGKWSTGVVMVDINNDGWLDIYLCNAGYISGDNQENELYINNGDLTFSEQAAQYGLNNNGYTTHAAFFDMDLDGDLDAYILNNSFIPINTLNLSDRRDLPASEWPVKDFLKKGGDQLLRNDHGHYVDITNEAGIYNSLIGFGLGITVGDVNNDRWPDLYVSNDFYERDYLYINQKDGTFREEIMDRTDHISLSSMGADMADLNNDSYPEIFVTDMLPDDNYRLRSTSSFESYSVSNLKLERNFHHQFMQNTLQLNRGDGTFSEIAHYAGVAATDWSWGALMFDMDLDGWKDIYVCNGIQHDVTDQDFIDFFADEIIQKMALTGRKEELETVLNKMPSNPILNKIFRNKGDLTFEDVSTAWSPSLPSFSNGAAYGDLDNDGDLDLVVNNVNHKAFLLKNNQQENNKTHYLSIRLHGGQSNTYAIGTVLKAYAENNIFTVEIMPSRGFQSSVDYKTILGIGNLTKIDSLEILWPGFERTVILSPPLDSTLVIHYSASKKSIHTLGKFSQEPLFTELQNDFLPHREDDFIDFYSEGLLMHKLSKEGPAYIRGDISGDGMADIVIGGAAGQPTMVYIRKNGGWTLTTDTGLENESDFEDVVAVLHDLDNDGDHDLVIGSGGNNVPPETRNLQDRVYLNDGNGKFTLSPNALPPNGYNTSAIGIDDIDKDGDPDLIICSRSIPGNFGPPPPNYIYLNDGKAKFRIATDEIAPEFKFAGLITDIAIIDIYGDSSPEWILTRQWASPVIFTQNHNQFVPLSSNLSEYPGWWLAIEAADLDNDGDRDLIMGNRGENFYFSGQSDDQFKLWIKDIDHNGTVENIVTHTISGKDVPVPLKKELTEQLPFLKKQNLKHKDFALTSIQDLLTTEQLDGALVLESRYHSNVIAWNDGNGQFVLSPLPAAVQLSSVVAIETFDVNSDGLPDLFLGGNNFNFLPQFSRLDASRGHILINNGNREWKVLKETGSGWSVKGELKHVEIFQEKNSVYMICIRNNDKPLLFTLNQKVDL